MRIRAVGVGGGELGRADDCGEQEVSPRPSSVALCHLRRHALLKGGVLRNCA